MNTTTLDSICRSVLLRKRYPLHFYLDALIAARDCLRELTLDTLNIIHVKLLPVNEYGAVEIPEGCVDVVDVSVNAGGKKKMLVRDDKIVGLYDYDSSFNVPNATSLGNLYYGFFSGNYGNYSFGVGGYYDGGAYTVIPERNEIQLRGVGDTEVAVACIGDGQSADAATHVEMYAVRTIEDYILWQFAEMSRTSGLGEKQRLEQKYLNSMGILRARKSNLSISGIKRSISRNSR